MSFADDAKRMLRRYGRMLLFLVIILLIMDNVFGTHGFLAMRRTQKEIAAVKKELERLNQENIELGGQVKALKTDPKLIEQIARDELGLSRRGEWIIRIPRPQQDSSRAPAKP
jgi:cell division protein FtsL